jgi:nucleotide sugar dehydrogenase
MDNLYRDLRNSILKKEVKIAVVGLGYVGLPLALEFSKVGFEVLGIDVDKDRIEHIRRRVSYITDVPTKELKKAISAGKFSASGGFTTLHRADVIIICVPTPLKRKYHPNISYIRQAVKSIAKNMKNGCLIVLESTTYPGTTQELILPLLEDHNLRHGRDFYLSFSPERIDPGNKDYPVHKIPKVVGGINKEATELAVLVYKNIIEKVVPVSSARVAEVVKLLENTFRLVNIGLIDELAMMAHKMKIDIWEVIEAAKTKPFGFMPFYPGPGVGGHCLDKEESIFVKEDNYLKGMQMYDFVNYIQGREDRDVEVLSFDPLKKTSVFKKVTAASVRPYFGQMVNITTQDGRRLKVTELHPMFVYNTDSWQLKYAKDLQRGDCLPLYLGLPRFSNISNPMVDLIEHVKQKGLGLAGKIRVKPVGFSWKDYALEIKSVLRKINKDKLPDNCWEYLSNNWLPLEHFYEIEKLRHIEHSKVKLVSGRGASYSEMPAQIALDADFCRLVGYYLSEGCYTKDKSARIRFSFNCSEKEYIQDTVNILASLGIKTSIYQSKKCRTSCIKVSSNLFGFLIRDILDCGSNCYNMKIPAQIFSLGKEEKIGVLCGIFRGDACVEHFFGKWRYRKNQKNYFHNVNTANISFFTSSQKLFQQLVILLHDLGIIPSFKRRKYTLSIFGYKQLGFFRDIFAGKKKEILLKYLALNKNKPVNKTFKREKGFATVKVKDISLTKGDLVYSIETVKPHSFVTSFGIAVHNCIPKDPLYLYWKARHHGFKPKFIKLASNIISRMPEYITERVVDLLRHKTPSCVKATKGRQDAGSKIQVLVVGATYKKDIKDLRKSPAIDMIDAFHKKGIKVGYYDPLIPYLKINHVNLKSIGLSREALGRFDCTVIATDHSNVDYDFILKHSRQIFDTRNVYRNIDDKKIARL